MLIYYINQSPTVIIGFITKGFNYNSPNSR